MENNAERFFNYSRTVANAIIPLEERMVDEFYDSLKKIFRIFKPKSEEGAAPYSVCRRSPL
jgi:hypothetical protein